jgi:hypothetical protein
MARAAWGITAAALLTVGAMLVWNSSLKADNADLSEQLSAAEDELAALQRVASRSGNRRSEPVRRMPERPDDEALSPEDLLAEIPPEDLLNTPGIEHQLQAAVQEQVKAEIGNRRAEWMERRRAEVGENIATFAEEADLSEADREEVTAVMEDGLEDAANILRSRRENHATPEAAREAMLELRESIQDDLTDLIGPEDTEAFLETIHGPLKGSEEP